MKISYVFEVPYIIRTGSITCFTINHEGLKSVVEILNPDGFEYSPWLSVPHKSGVSGQIFSHYDENFRVNKEKNHSIIKISVTLGRKTLESFPESKLGPIIAWKKSLIDGKVITKIIDFLFNKVMKTYDRFIDVYTFITKEIYNSSYIETIFQKSFPFGVKIYIDDEFVGQYHFIQGTSLIPLSEEEEHQLGNHLKKDIQIDVVQNLLFQSLVSFLRKKYKFSLLTLAQSLEIFIDNYLSSSRNFIIDEDGFAWYIFTGDKQRVNTQRKYIDVLEDYKEASLLDYDKKLWDDLDKIIQLRHRIIHKNEVLYVESKKHQKIRNNKKEKLLELYIDLSDELPNLYNSAREIINWVMKLP